MPYYGSMIFCQPVMFSAYGPVAASVPSRYNPMIPGTNSPA